MAARAAVSADPSLRYSLKVSGALSKLKRTTVHDTTPTVLLTRYDTRHNDTRSRQLRQRRTTRRCKTISRPALRQISVLMINMDTLNSVVDKPTTARRGFEGVGMGVGVDGVGVVGDGWVQK